MIGANGDGGATMTLPAVLDLAAAESFHATLLQQAQGGALLRLDASGVETLTLPCIQIILAASRNYDVTIEAPSEGSSARSRTLLSLGREIAAKTRSRRRICPRCKMPPDEAPDWSARLFKNRFKSQVRNQP